MSVLAAQEWRTTRTSSSSLVLEISELSSRATNNESKELRIALLGGFSVMVGKCDVTERFRRKRRPASILKALALTPGHALHREAPLGLSLRTAETHLSRILRKLNVCAREQIADVIRAAPPLCTEGYVSPAELVS